MTDELHRLRALAVAVRRWLAAEAAERAHAAAPDGEMGACSPGWYAELDDLQGATDAALAAVRVAAQGAP